MLEGAEEGSAIAEVLENETMSFAKALKAAVDNIRSKVHSEEIDALLALLNLLPMKKKDMDSYLEKHPICVSAKNDKGNVNASSVKARIAVLRETTPVPEMYAEDYEQLMSLYTLMAKNDEQSKLVKVLKAQLEQSHGVDIAIDCLGGANMGESLHYLNRGARWIMIAALAGTKTDIDLKNIYVRNVRIIGSTLRSRAPEVKAQILADLVRNVWPKVESGEVKPTIYRVLPIQEAEAAHDILYKGQNVGKVVLAVH